MVQSTINFLDAGANASSLNCENDKSFVAGTLFFMEEEIWKDLIGFDYPYMASNKGRIKVLDRMSVCRWAPYIKKERILKLTNHGDGYLQVRLRINNAKKSFLVHRIIASAFLTNPENKPQINHLNGIKYDNRIENLERCTQSENIKHAFETGLNKPPCHEGEKNPLHKINSSIVKEIRKKFVPYKYTSTMLAKEYNISASNVRSIANGKAWKHIV